MARRKKRRAAAAPRRRRRQSSVRANPVRRRRRGIAKFTSAARRRVGLNPRRRHVSHRRRHHRNPGSGFGGGSILRSIIRGAGDGLAVAAGGGLTNYVASKIPFGQTTTIGQAATQLVVGTGLGLVVKKITKSDRAAAMFVAGAYANVIRKLAAATPLAPFLSGVGVYPRAAAVGVYPRPRLAGWAASPSGFPLIAAGARGGGRDSSHDLGTDVDMIVMSGASGPVA